MIIYLLFQALFIIASFGLVSRFMVGNIQSFARRENSISLVILFLIVLNIQFEYLYVVETTLSLMIVLLLNILFFDLAMMLKAKQR